ncbi:MAG TPA: MFS transporter [Pyrinomonadaceae bacterium]|nr:MFS transporter [Pyrinomonadaceae bacterium]
MQRAQPRLSFWQIWNMSFGFFGIQFAFGLQQANMSNIFKNLGAKTEDISILWLAAPLTGLIVQPIIGSMSDRTWNRLGRRRPYFLVGAILSAVALFFMPYSVEVWMAVAFLWMLDASVNVSMEPFRAFVADKLDIEQRTTGFVMQSFFIGAGAAIASALPYMFRQLGVNDSTASGVPLTVKYSFQLGALALLFAVLWTVFTTKEHPPENVEEFKRRRAETRGAGNWFREIFAALKEMPTTMKQLAVVQVFTWLGLFCMWMFYGLATAQQVFGVTNLDDPAQRVLKDQGNEWGGLGFAVYSVVCFLVAFALPKLAAATSRKTVHALALVCGGVGLLSTYFIHGQYTWMLSMVGVGIAWASILSMPYAILSGALPPARMGVYMGVFNFFIVLPEIFAALTFQPLVKYVFNNNPLYVVMLGGACLLVAAALVSIVRDVAERVPVGAVIRGDAHEPLTTTVMAQPVPSTGLMDNEK